MLIKSLGLEGWGAGWVSRNDFQNYTVRLACLKRCCFCLNLEGEESRSCHRNCWVLEQATNVLPLCTMILVTKHYRLIIMIITINNTKNNNILPWLPKSRSSIASTSLSSSKSSFKVSDWLNLNDILYHSCKGGRKMSLLDFPTCAVEEGMLERKWNRCWAPVLVSVARSPKLRDWWGHTMRERLARLYWICHSKLYVCNPLHHLPPPNSA